MNKLLPNPIVWLLAAFVLLAGIYAVTTPLFEASDELWHYPLVQRLSKGGDLPVQDPNNVGPWRQEASQPPLYYYLMGWITSGIDTSDMQQVRWLNPHVDNGLIPPDGNVNLAIHTPVENWPWHGTVLAVRLIRLLSVLMGAGTVYLTFLLALELCGDTSTALLAAGLVGFVPMFAFIAGAVNNDNLSSLLSSLMLYWLVWLARRPRVYSWQHGLGLGLLLGLAALTKQSALGLYPLTGLTLAAMAVGQHGLAGLERLKRSLFFLFRSALVVFVPALAVPAPWYYRNVVLYGDLLGWNGFITVLGRRAAPATLLQLWGERESFYRSYWGLFGGVNVPMSTWVYWTLNCVAVAGSIGFVIMLVRAAMAARPTKLGIVGIGQNLVESLASWFPWALMLGMLALLAVGLYQWATITWSSQGRLVFSGISAIAVTLAAGWRALLPAATRKPVFAAIIACMAGVTASAPFLVIGPTYRDPAALSSTEIATIPRSTPIDFGALNFPPEMRLLGYTFDSADIHPGGNLSVHVYWQSLVQMDRDWSVFVHLVDENGIIVAHRDVFPGRGLMPTRKWSTGQVLSDTYVLRLPETAYAPSPAHLEIGLYDFATGDRLLVMTEGVADAGRDALDLGAAPIKPNPGGLPNPQTINFGGQIRLDGFDMDQRLLRPGGSLTLKLYWSGESTMAADYTAFAHVRGDGESLWAGSDSWPGGPALPTSQWLAGQTVEDVRTLTLKPDTPEGVYDVEVGLYDSTGRRLQVRLPDGELTDNFVYLAKIRVAP